MNPNAAAQRYNSGESGKLSSGDLEELRARSLDAEAALARGECVDMADVLAELDEIATAR